MAGSPTGRRRERASEREPTAAKTTSARGEAPTREIPNRYLSDNRRPPTPALPHTDKYNHRPPNHAPTTPHRRPFPANESVAVACSPAEFPPISPSPRPPTASTHQTTYPSIEKECIPGQKIRETNKVPVVAGGCDSRPAFRLQRRTARSWPIASHFLSLSILFDDSSLRLNEPR